MRTSVWLAVAAAVVVAPAARAQERPPAAAQAMPSTADLYRLIQEQQVLLEKQGREIDALRRRLDEAERRPGTAPPPAAAVQEDEQRLALPELSKGKSEAQEFPGAFAIPGSNARLRIGGQVRTLLVRNLGAVGSDDRFVTSSIPVEGTAEAEKTSRTTLSASPSRFNLDLRTPSSVGGLRAFVEGDFAGAGNTYRLRHAFGQWRGILAGQTWSTFSDPEAEPDGIDFEGLNAISLFRQPQLRWTHQLSERFVFALALENPSPDITGATGVNQVPDVVARVRFEPRGEGPRLGGLLRGNGHIQAAYLVRQIRGEPSTETSAVLSTGGTGYHVSGRLPAPWRSADDLTFATALGRGIGRYITDLGSEGGQDAVFDPDANTLRPLDAVSWYVGYEHWWTATLRSTGTYGFVGVRNLDVQAPDALYKTHRASVNLAWSPLARVDIVAELLTGRRTNKDRRTGRAGQAQFGWTFRF